MAVNKEPKYYILMSYGHKFEISELDFNNLKGRQGRGQTAGWYTQRGRVLGTLINGASTLKKLCLFGATQNLKEMVEIETLMSPND